MTALNAAARAALRDAGVGQAEWARAHGYQDGRWGGDACGCTDDRCIGYHHDGPEDCGCLDVLLAEYVATRAQLVPLTVLREAFPEWQVQVGADLLWHAWLRDTPERPVPHLAARTLGELAGQLNDHIAGDQR